MEQESPRFLTYFFFEIVVCLIISSNTVNACAGVLRLTDLQLSRSVIKAGCCL